jgi:hypothetical protein
MAAPSPSVRQTMRPESLRIGFLKKSNRAIPIRVKRKSTAAVSTAQSQFQAAQKHFPERKSYGKANQANS